MIPELLDSLVGTVLLAPQPPPGGQGEDFGKSSPVGFVVLLLFFVAVALLIRSMNKHLKRVPESFDPQPDAGPAERVPDDRVPDDDAAPADPALSDPGADEPRRDGPARRGE